MSFIGRSYLTSSQLADNSQWGFSSQVAIPLHPLCMCISSGYCGYGTPKEVHRKYAYGTGLFSKAIWSLENHAWVKATGGDSIELSPGPDSYDVHQSVWHVNCCQPTKEGWGMFYAVIGWQNSATYGSVVACNLYWLVVILGRGTLIVLERRKPKPVEAEKSGQVETSEAGN
ncbi:FTR1-domain-containing protein [Piedraia hortae CBS 480.64]|uniref:FTR1-domain-containing protein n=1 Tax=Piedraia hortae CBS 480.64 TaxID=1314780 RepID=A0A6A7BYC1_9PEZI|nr:FTR1-domain-containing protein [Piedraia hortae CBS 480.64]